MQALSGRARSGPADTAERRATVHAPARAVDRRGIVVALTVALDMWDRMTDPDRVSTDDLSSTDRPGVVLFRGARGQAATRPDRHRYPSDDVLRRRGPAWIEMTDGGILWEIDGEVFGNAGVGCAKTIDHFSKGASTQAFSGGERGRSARRPRSGGPSWTRTTDLTLIRGALSPPELRAP
jgi:hypothetical protein